MNSKSKEKTNNLIKKKRDFFYLKSLKLILKFKRKEKISQEEFFLLKNDLITRNSILKEKIIFFYLSNDKKNFKKMVEKNLEIIFFQIRFKNSVSDILFTESSSKNLKRESSPISNMFLRRKIQMDKENKKKMEFKIVLKKIH